MDQEILQRIDTLAEKLGVVGEQLWTVLVLQVHIHVIQKIIPIICGIIYIFLFYRWWSKLGKKDPFEYEHPFVLIGWIVAVIMVIFILLESTDIIGMIINPEYYALQKLLR
jgi:hypothetical protein